MGDRLLARVLRRLSGTAQLERLAAIEEKVGQFGRAHREELGAQRHRLDELATRLSGTATTASVRDLRREIEDLRESLAGQDRTVAEALERARLFDAMAMEDRRFARRMEQMARRGRRILVGPWTGEVGFELLYWVPFVRWVVERYRIAPERLVVVSRGGPASWYGAGAERYVDVLAHFTSDEFRAGTLDARKKQRRVNDLDVRIVERVRAAGDLADADLLHPGMMYRLFMPFWRDEATVARVDAYTTFARLQVPDDPVRRTLPAEYVAARFYFSDCFPDTPANRAFVASTLEAIARHVPVVLLNTAFALDDHRDAAAAGTRMVTVAERMTPERNLATQTAIVAGARAFVGTYGGYSYLAPFCGVPALAFYSAPTFKAHHLHLAQRVFERLGGARLTPLDTAAVPLVRLGVAGLFEATA
jgi:hypothetical protein